VLCALIFELRAFGAGKEANNAERKS